jgi:SPP1 family predicted phage head-tail adaptor
MKAGRLRNSIRIDRAAISQDDLGAPIKTWVPLVTVHAEIASVTGREFFASSQDQPEVTTRIFVRETPGVVVDADCRITNLDDGSIYDVVAVLPSTIGEMLTIIAKRGASYP